MGKRASGGKEGPARAPAVAGGCRRLPAIAACASAERKHEAEPRPPAGPHLRALDADGAGAHQAARAHVRSHRVVERGALQRTGWGARGGQQISCQRRAAPPHPSQAPATSGALARATPPAARARTRIWPLRMLRDATLPPSSTMCCARMRSMSSMLWDWANASGLDLSAVSTFWMAWGGQGGGRCGTRGG